MRNALPGPPTQMHQPGLRKVWVGLYERPGRISHDTQGAAAISNRHDQDEEDRQDDEPEEAAAAVAAATGHLVPGILQVVFKPFERIEKAGHD